MIYQKWVSLLIVIYGVILSGNTSSALLEKYNQTAVLNFMKNLETDNLTKECTGSIRKALVHLSHRERQRQLFITAFTSGDASKFQNTEHDRWIFNALACINAAGEQNFHASPIPLSFCALMNGEFEGTAYGICIPTSCLNEKYKILSSWKTISLFNDGTKEEKPFEICLSSRHKEQWYQQWKPILVFCFLSLFPCLVVISSTNQNNQFGYKNVSPFYQQLLQAFSLKENLKLLAHVPKEPNSTITCIVGLRVLAAFWSVLAHTVMLIKPFFENLEEYKDDMVNGFWNQALTNNTLVIDIFFVISGTLTSFNWFKSKENTQQQTWSSVKYWLKFYRHRVFRLWPTYIFVLILSTYLAITFYHPMWPPIDAYIQCPKHFLENLFFLNALYRPACLPHTWYIGTEFIFFLLSPVFLLMFKCGRVGGWTGSILIISISSILNVHETIRNNFPPAVLHWKHLEMFNQDWLGHFLALYIKPQYRIGSYIIGLILGFELANIQPNQLSMKKKKKRIYLSVSMFLLGCLTIHGLYPAIQDWDWTLYHLLYGAVFRNLFAISIALLIYNCHVSESDPFNKILSLKLWMPLSSISYSVYLIHVVPITFTFLLDQFPMTYTDKWHIAFHYLVQLSLSIAIGFIVTMSVEIPFRNLERIFSKKKIHLE